MIEAIILTMHRTTKVKKIGAQPPNLLERKSDRWQLPKGIKTLFIVHQSITGF